MTDATIDMMENIYAHYPQIKHIACLTKKDKIVYLIGEQHAESIDVINIMTLIEGYYGITTPIIAETCFSCENDMGEEPAYPHLLSIHKHHAKTKVPLFFWGNTNRCNACQNVLSLSPEFNLILSDETYLYFLTYLQQLVYQTGGKIQFDSNAFKTSRGEKYNPGGTKKTLLQLQVKLQALSIPTVFIDSFLEAIENKTDIIIHMDEFDINREIRHFAEYLISQVQILIGKKIPLIKKLLVGHKSKNIRLLDAVLMIEDILSEDLTIASANQLRVLFFQIGRLLVELETYEKINTMLLKEVIIYFGVAHTKNLQAILEYDGWDLVFEENKSHTLAQIGNPDVKYWNQGIVHDETKEFLHNVKLSITKAEKYD